MTLEQFPVRKRDGLPNLQARGRRSARQAEVETFERLLSQRVLARCFYCDCVTSDDSLMVMDAVGLLACRECAAYNAAHARGRRARKGRIYSRR